MGSKARIGMVWVAFLHGANDHRAEAKDGMGRPFNHFYCDRIEMLGVDVELDIDR
jgi:hypothetical protein